MAHPNPEDIYSIMGFTLTVMQSVEQTLRFVSTFVLQDGVELNMARLESINKKERKQALGYFLGKIRNRTELLPHLDNVLTTYLNNRNDFIHNQGAIPGWNLAFEEGVAVAIAFTFNLLNQAHRINEIFSALMMDWGEQIGLDIPEQIDIQYLEEVRNNYGELIYIYFTKK